MSTSSFKSKVYMKSIILQGRIQGLGTKPSCNMKYGIISMGYIYTFRGTVIVVKPIKCQKNINIDIGEVIFFGKQNHTFSCLYILLFNRYA